MNSKFSFYYKAPAEFINESIALFARMTVQPSIKQKLVINDTIKALKNAGIWDLLDVLVLLHSHDTQSAYLNWKISTANGSPTNSPVFTAFQGVLSANTKYINSNFIPSAGIQYKLNNASARIMTSTNAANLPVYDIIRGSTGLGTLAMYRKINNEYKARINNTSSNIIYISIDVTGEPSNGLFSVDLLNNTAKLFKNGIKRKEETYNSLALPAASVFIGQNNPSNYQMYYFSASLTNQQHADFNMIINNYIANYHA